MRSKNDNDCLVAPTCGQLLFFGAVFLLAASVGVIMFVGLPFTNDSGSFWQAVSAIATGAAAFSAIGVALYGHCKEGRGRRSEGDILRYVLSHELSMVADGLRCSFFVLSNFYRGTLGHVSLTDSDKKSLTRFCEAAEMPVTRGLVTHLHKLPSNEGKAISVILGRIHRCANACRDSLGADRDEDGLFEFHRHNFIESVEEFRLIASQFIMALDRISNQKSFESIRALHDVANHTYWLDQR